MPRAPFMSRSTTILPSLTVFAPPLAPGARAARPGAVHLPTIARGADHDLPPAPLAVEQAPSRANRPAHRPLSSGVDPDAKMPDNAREFGPRDRLVRVRRRGVLPNFAQRRIALSFDAALASGRGHGKGAAGGTATGSGDGEGNDPQRRRASATAPGFVPQARIVRRGGTRRKTPDGRGLAITDPRRAERR